MVDFQDPVVMIQDYKILVRLCAVSYGVYIWEFFTSLDYEWDVIRGRRPYRWTIWIYSVARLTALMTVIADLIMTNSSLRDCQTLITLNFAFPYISLAFSSLLILIRISPIWNKDKLAVSLATGVWMTNVSFLIAGAAEIRAWDPGHIACAVVNVQSNKRTFISILATDFALLLIMLVGLCRLRNPGKGWFDLGRLLWKQGVIWVLIATIAELLPVVFLCLNLNDALSLMFMMPTMVTMSIAATRMYRFLANFCSYKDLVVSSSIVRRSGHHVRHTSLARRTLDQLEVAVRETYDYEQYPGSTMDKDISFVTIEGQELGKSLEPSLHEDAEGNV